MGLDIYVKKKHGNKYEMEYTLGENWDTVAWFDKNLCKIKNSKYYKLDTTILQKLKSDMEAIYDEQKMCEVLLPNHDELYNEKYFNNVSLLCHQADKMIKYINKNKTDLYFYANW